MANDKKLIAKRIDPTKLLDELEKNHRKVAVNRVMDYLYTAIMNNEKQNPKYQEIIKEIGDDNYNIIVNQIVFTMAMNLTVATLPKKEVMEVIARCDMDKEENAVKGLN